MSCMQWWGNSHPSTIQPHSRQSQLQVSVRDNQSSIVQIISDISLAQALNPNFRPLKSSMVNEVSPGVQLVGRWATPEEVNVTCKRFSISFCIYQIWIRSLGSLHLAKTVVQRWVRASGRWSSEVVL
jgi:hypothetical protein